MKLCFTNESRGTLKSLTLLISVKSITKLNLGHIDKSEINRRVLTGNRYQVNRRKDDQYDVSQVAIKKKSYLHSQLSYTNK